MMTEYTPGEISSGVCLEFAAIDLPSRPLARVR